MTFSISLRGLLLVVLAAGMMAIASLMLRYSIDKVGGFGGDIARVHEDIIRLLLQPVFVLGVFLYGTGTLVWMRVIATESLSIGYPILVSSSFIVITLGASAFFNEPFSLLKGVGMALIIVGVFIATQG